MNINIGENFDIDAQLMMTGRGCIIGQSGSGKSYLVGVIVEELCKLSLPFVIIDTEGEYASLKETFKAIWAGANERADVGMDIDMRELFRKSLDGSIPVIFDVSEVADKTGVVYNALSALYAIEEEKRTPYLVIIEEADKFAPQVVRAGVNMVEELSVRGRKRGIGLLVATQRPANISKNVLAQCGFGLIGKLSIENDIQAINILFEDKKALATIPSLKTGSFMPFGLPYSDEVRIKRRIVKHIGSTPSLKSGYVTSELKTVLAELKSESKPISARERASTSHRIQTQKREQIDAIPRRITPAEAATIAEKLAKRSLLIGPRSEKIDEVKPRYEKAFMATMRVPTRRTGEFIEGCVIVSNNNFVFINDRITFTRATKNRPIKLSPNELAVISALNRKGKADDAALSKFTGLNEQAVLRASYRLKRAGVIVDAGGKLSLSSKPKRLLAQHPKLEKTSVTDDMLANGKQDRTAVSLLLSNAIPGAEAVEMREIYLPLYEVSYRKGNNVRIITIDGVSGKLLPRIA